MSSPVRRRVSDQPPDGVDDQRHSTLDFVNGTRMNRVERRRDPQLRQRLLSRTPRILQEAAELRDAPPATGLRYVWPDGERRPDELIPPRRGSRSGWLLAHASDSDARFPRDSVNRQ